MTFSGTNMPMDNLDAKVRQAKEAGYDDVQIVDYLSARGMGQQMEEARQAGHSYNDIVRHLSGEKRGVGERLKQGMAGAYLGTAQIGSYLAEKTGLGDIRITSDGIKYESPEEARAAREKIEGGISELDIQKGDPGIGESLLIAAGDPSMWGGATVGGPLWKQGLKSGLLFGAVQPQSGEFDPAKKAQDVATTGALSAVAAPVLGKMIDTGAKYSPTRLMAKGAKHVAGKVTGKDTPSAVARASTRVKDLVADPMAAASRMDAQSLSGLSAARQSGEPGLIGLEEAVRKTSPEIEKRFAEQEMRSRAVLSDEARSIGDGVAPSKTTEFIEGRRDAVVQKLNDGVKLAEQRAQEKISLLSPEMRESEAALIVRDELENALKAARAQENLVWEAIPNAGLTTAGIKRRYAELVSKTPKAQLDDVPAVASELLGKQGRFKNIENVAELQGLRSKLLEEARNARAVGNYNKARISDELADAVLDDLGAQSGATRGPTGEALRKALDYSRTLNETYRQGNVGRVLGTSRVGGDRVAPELTLGSTIGAGGTRGGVAADELIAAAPSVGAGMRDYVLQRFNKSAVKDGNINPQAAEKFVRENADILDKFPDIRQSINEAASATGTLSSKQARAERVTNALFAKQKSATAEYLGAPVDKEFARIMAAQNPGKLAFDLKRMAAKDQTGDAVKGLKTGAVEYLMAKAATGADEAGNVVMSGNKLKSLLNDSRTSAALRNTLSPDELQHLNRIANELSALERKGTPVGTIIDAPMPNKIMTMAARVLGAKAGAKLGGGDAGASLQSAQIGSSNAKEYLKSFINDKAEELLIQSVQDKTLRDLLLMDISTPAKQVEVAKRLSRWAEMNKGFMVVPVVDQITDEEGNSAPERSIPPDSSLQMQYSPMSLNQLEPSAGADDYLQKLAMVESSGNPNAKATTSSATGLFQFTDGTWKEMVNKYGEEYGLTLDGRLDPEQQMIAGQLFTEENAGKIQNAIGREPTEGELYAAHFLGAGGAIKALKAKPSTKAAFLFPQAAKANRNIFYDGKRQRSIGEVLELLNNKITEA